jgi:hypothetical protein
MIPVKIIENTNTKPKSEEAIKHQKNVYKRFYVWEINADVSDIARTDAY